MGRRISRWVLDNINFDMCCLYIKQCEHIGLYGGEDYADIVGVCLRYIYKVKENKEYAECETSTGGYAVSRCFVELPYIDEKATCCVVNKVKQIASTYAEGHKAYFKERYEDMKNFLEETAYLALYDLMTQLNNYSVEV